LRVHDARSCWLSSALPRFAPGSGLGVLAWLVPPGLAREVLGAARAEAAEAAGPAAPARRLRLLPPLLGVYFTLALCLFSDLPYRDVLRGVPGAPGAAVTALTGLRRRLGPRPLDSVPGLVCYVSDQPDLILLPGARPGVIDVKTSMPAAVAND